MNDLIPIDDRPAVDELLPVAMAINREHDQVRQCVAQGLEHAKRAGELLHQAKAALPHGEWLPWLAAHCEVSERTAQAYMRIAAHWPELEAKAQRVADLPFRQAVALLAEPSDETLAAHTPDERLAAADEALKSAIRNKLEVQRDIAFVMTGPPPAWRTLTTPEGMDDAFHTELHAAEQEILDQAKLQAVRAAKRESDDDDALWETLPAELESLRTRLASAAADPYALLDIIDRAEEYQHRVMALTARANCRYRQFMPEFREMLAQFGISAPKVLFEKMPLEMTQQERGVCDQFFETLVSTCQQRFAELNG